MDEINSLRKYRGMKMNDFKNGKLDYSAEIKNAPEIKKLDFDSWDDGYIAFSNAEFRLRELGDSDIKALFNGRIQGLWVGEKKLAAEGYLMELDVWKKNGAAYEELSIEREDDGFYVQQWKLDTQSVGEKDSLCFWRHASIRPRGNSLLAGDDCDKLESIEVIVPENRLHFFITVTEAKTDG